MQLVKQLSVAETQMSGKAGNSLLDRCEFGETSG
jgi:hypothetical protein